MLSNCRFYPSDFISTPAETLQHSRKLGGKKPQPECISFLPFLLKRNEAGLEVYLNLRIINVGYLCQ